MHNKSMAERTSDPQPTPPPPYLKVTLSLTSPTYDRSAPFPANTLTITTTLHSRKIVMFDIRGEFWAENVLSTPVRFQHFDWFDLTSNCVVHHPDPFENTCDPSDELGRDQVVTLFPGGTPHVMSQEFEDVDPLCDPVRLLRDGHRYRIRLKPQKVRWRYGTADEVFKGEKSLPAGEMEKEAPVVLESSDELYLTVVGDSRI